MKKFLLLPAILLAACASVPTTPPLPAPDAIDAEVARLMQVEDVKGLALAVIDKGEIVRTAAYGHRNVEKDLPLETDTVMYGASLTKTAVAYTVLQLCQEGLFDLDTPLGDYLKKPLPQYEEFADLAANDRWKDLTARIVLTHSTGLPNFRWLEDDGVLRFHWDPGKRYGYSGEGFYILQLAIEEHLGEDLGTIMDARVFVPLGMKNTSMMWRADFAENLADGYAIDSSFIPHDERSGPSAAGSMDTTIEDQALMWQAILKGDRLTAASHADFFRPQLPIHSAHQVPTLWDFKDPRTEQVHLSAGLGLVTAEGPHGLTVFKGGHDDGTGNMAICEPELERCVVFLSNSVRAELIYPDLAAFILGDNGMPWWWEYNPD